MVKARSVCEMAKLAESDENTEKGKKGAEDGQDVRIARCPLENCSGLPGVDAGAAC